MAALAVSVVRFQERYSLAKAWFDGNQEIRMDQMELQTYNARIRVTKSNLLYQIDAAIKQGSATAALPNRGASCSAWVRLNERWYEGVEFSANRFEGTITIGIPDSLTLFQSDYIYRTIRVETNCAATFSRAIECTHNLQE
jgi:hypothetical protein